MKLRAVLLGGLAGLVVGLLASASPVAAAPQYPAPDGRCVDQTGVLGDALCAKVTAILLSDEKTNDNEIAVAVVPTTGEQSIEAYSTGLFNYWGVGKRDKNNGVLLVVAVDDHRLRLETGSGRDGMWLSDNHAKYVIDSIITPKFRQGEYAGGILAGLDEVRLALGHDVRQDRLAALTPPSSATRAAASGQGGGNGGPWIWVVIIGAMVMLPVIFVTVIISVLVRSGRRGSRRGFSSNYSTSTTDPSSYSSFSSSSGGSDFGGGSSSGGGASGTW